MADKNQLDDLSRYWNAVARGEPPPLTGINPTISGAVDWAMALDDVPGPDASFVARLESSLGLSGQPKLAQLVPFDALGERRRTQQPANSSADRRPMFAVHARPRGRARTSIAIPTIPGRQLFSYVSLAIVALLAFGGIWINFESSNRDNQQSFLNTAQISDDLNNLVSYEGYLQRIILDPGAFYATTKFGPTLITVQDGSVEFQSLLDREGGLLSPGESVSASSGSTVILRNTTESPVALLISGVCPIDTLDRKLEPKPGVHIKNLAEWWFSVGDADRATVSIDRTRLQENDRIPQFQTITQTWILAETDAMAVTLSGESVPANFQPDVENSIPAMRPLSLLGGITVDVRNAGATPLTVYVVTITVEPMPTS